MLLVLEWASGERSAAANWSNVMVACSAMSHLPPLVIKSEPTSAELLTAASPQKTAMRPEHELLVTCNNPVRPHIYTNLPKITGTHIVRVRVDSLDEVYDRFIDAAFRALVLHRLQLA
jgi:hypothetical protein